MFDCCIKIFYLSFYRQYNCTNEQVANNGKNFPATTSNPCYEATSVFLRNDTVIYDQPRFITSDHNKAKMNSNVAYGTAQRSLKSCHATGSATTDVSAEDHVDDGVIETKNDLPIDKIPT